MKNKEEEFIITIEMSDEPEYIKEKNYNELKKYIINMLKNINEYKENQTPV